MHIRLATAQDLPNLMALLQLKAAFDGCPESLLATPEKLESTIFCPSPMAYILLVDVDGSPSPVGLASYHFTYSTFLARPSIWLDDLFVTASYRNQSIGAALIQHLCQIAKEQDCGRIDWTVDVDNAAGIRFYRRMGAALKTQVHLCRLDQGAIASNLTVSSKPINA